MTFPNNSVIAASGWNKQNIYLYLLNTVYHLLIWLWRMKGKGRGGRLKERGSSLYDGGGGLVEI